MKSSGYEPSGFVDHNEKLQQIFAQLSDGFFEPEDAEVFHPIINALLNQGDYYMLLADFESYVAKQEELNQAYSESDEWNRKAIINVANMGHFSSDRSIQNYAERVWQVEV